MKAMKGTETAADWRSTLFPEATDEEFADSYAQTLAYSLLLAKLSLRRV